MKLSWKRVKCAKCATCIKTRHGVPDDVNWTCESCYIERLNRRADKNREVISEIFRIAGKFTLDEAHHVCHGSEADYMKWLLELNRIGADALSAIRKALAQKGNP